MAHDAVYATLLTKTEYLPGALVLEDSLRAVGSIYPLVIMITPTVPKEVRDVLDRRGIQMVEIHPLQPEEGVHAVAEHDARFADTWTKLRYVVFAFANFTCISLTMIIEDVSIYFSTKCVYPSFTQYPKANSSRVYSESCCSTLI